MSGRGAVDEIIFSSGQSQQTVRRIPPMKRLQNLWRKSALLTVLLVTSGSVSAWAQEAASASGADGAVSVAEATSFYNVVFGCGVVNLMTWVALFAVSLATVAFIIDGCLSIKRQKLIPSELINGVRESLANGDLAAATAACQVNPSPLSRILQAGFGNVQEGYDVTREAVTSCAEMENEKLIQRVSYLNVCGQIGPMLGLLGTVIGMVLAFASLATAAGASKAALLAIAISTALWTTVVGLLIAIPALLAYTLLKNYATRLILEMESTVLDLIKVLRNAEVQQ
jgi:biopolymer transport protein ExbB